MLINPYRDTWVVAEEFDFRGVKMVVGSKFRIRTLHPRVWKKLINGGFLVKHVDYLAKTTAKPEPSPEVIPEVKSEEIIPESTVETVNSEVKIESKKKPKKKKSTKKKES